MFVSNTKGVALVYAILISPFFKITFYNQLCGVILLVIGEVSYIWYNSNILWGYSRVTTHISVFIVYFHVGVLIPILWFRFLKQVRFQCVSSIPAGHGASEGGHSYLVFFHLSMSMPEFWVQLCGFVFAK